MICIEYSVQEVLVRLPGSRSSLIFFDLRIIRWVLQHPEFLMNEDRDRLWEI